MPRFLSHDKKKKIENFRSTTNATDAAAKTYLERFGWDLNVAVDEYFSEGGGAMEVDSNGASKEAIDAWFDQYADPDDEDGTMNEDGILQFCEDVGLDPQDIVVLVIAWKMDAAYMCAFTREEWRRGMLDLGVDSAAKLKEQVPQLRTKIDDDKDFKEFYSFCFQFSKEPGQKSLAIDIATPMWELLLSSRYPKVTSDWLAFLQEKKPCKGVTKDTWNLLLEFFGKVHAAYDAYDENEAWPVLIDDFMSWIETRAK